MKYRKKNVFNKVVLVINIILGIALLFSYLAPSIDPKDVPMIAILGFCYQILMILNLCFVVFWLLRVKFYAMISIICILLGFNAFLMNFKFPWLRLSNLENRSNDFKIMAYNVRGFEGIDAHENEPIQKQVAKIIGDQHPSIVNFEEFQEMNADSGSKIKLIDSVLKPCFHFFKPFVSNNVYSLGNAIFTKFPIVDTGSITSPGFLDVRAIYVDIKCRARILRIYCIHLGAVNVGGDKEKYLNSGIIFSKTFFLTSRLTDAFVRRSHQVSKIKAHMDKCPYPFIVAGDFNDTPISYAVNYLSDGLNNAFIEKGSGLGTTYYSTFPKLHIDYILASPQFDILEYHEIDKKLSDHKPIISDVQLK